MFSIVKVSFDYNHVYNALVLVRIGFIACVAQRPFILDMFESFQHRGYWSSCFPPHVIFDLSLQLVMCVLLRVYMSDTFHFWPGVGIRRNSKREKCERRKS